jgi:hypothetical protein
MNFLPNVAVEAVIAKPRKWLSVVSGYCKCRGMLTVFALYGIPRSLMGFCF